MQIDLNLQIANLKAHSHKEVAWSYGAKFGERNSETKPEY